MPSTQPDCQHQGKLNVGRGRTPDAEEGVLDPAQDAFKAVMPYASSTAAPSPAEGTMPRSHTSYPFVSILVYAAVNSVINKELSPANSWATEAVAEAGQAVYVHVGSPLVLELVPSNTSLMIAMSELSMS